MSNSKFMEKKQRKDVPISNAYFALKSQNEIYYQMASILKQVPGNDGDQMAKIIFKRVLTNNHPKYAS